MSGSWGTTSIDRPTAPWVRFLRRLQGPGWVDTSAQAGIRYTYAVRARDAAGYLSIATALKSITAK